MGRYIDDILQPGEKVLYSTNAHWIFYLPAIAAWIVAIFLFLLSRQTTTEGIVLPYTDPRAGHVFHQYVIRAPRRDALRQYLQERQIGSEIYYPIPLHLQPCFAYLGYREGDFPEAERAAKEVLALPMFPELTEDEERWVVASVAEFYG